MQVSLVSALLHAKCPKCREGDMFVYPLTHLVKFNAMHKACPVCDERLEPEPGFYQGAMYVGYALSVAVTAFVFILVFLLDIQSMWLPVIIVGAIMVLLIPVNYRYSRVFYLYMFGGIHYRPKID
ncbi:MAG: DUF983 domain-containing protein [Cytophagia bacterium]|jgi:uncharacterized protein (DUF983 family)|nr:DUF983 domain-containing protein [Cytophagia bacterium]NBW36043.1 DUF983 domain-containing protein [Cytophagia bacterium]